MFISGTQSCNIYSLLIYTLMLLFCLTFSVCHLHVETLNGLTGANQLSDTCEIFVNSVARESLASRDIKLAYWCQPI